jgi:tetratricopeptide (TPR) repeat protein/TolB-like protein/predicted Ser/Thr protein kinase
VNPGDTISRYRIVGRIGKGGMGVVYRAEDSRLQRPVALKFLPRESLTEGNKYRFLNEARAAALARHPNICPIHDIEEADGEIFIVMAFIEGETLARRIGRGPLDPTQAVEIAAQVAAGLVCAHGLGIVHRDIKSSNIMIDASGHVSIMDFGLALAPDALRLTGEGSSVGTPDYMSPEQAQGKEVDARTDLWSLGVVMFEMLAGRLPFRREHRGALAHAILSDPIPRVEAAPELQAIVGRALVRDPDERWQSAAQMLSALRRVQAGNSAAPEAVATQTMVVPRARKRARIAAIVAAVVLAAAGGYATYYFRGPSVRSIAIFPFQAEGDSTISDGIDDVLTAALANDRSVSIVPSSDIRRRKITKVEDARKLHGVKLALMSSAKPAGDKVEFTFRLIDTATEKDVATRTVVYDSKNPLVSRDQVIGQVMRMLGAQPPAPEALKARETAAPDAYSAYLEGRGLLARYDIAANVNKAIASFEKATQQDSKFALAYAGLAEAHWRKGRAARDPKATALAHQNAEYAVQLDPDLAAAHAILGSIYRDAGRTEDAIREFQRATDLAPVNAEAPRQLAEIYKSSGRFDEAERLYVQATISRPVDWYGYLLLGLFYYERERYTEAETALKEASNLAPDNDLVRTNLGGVYRMHGRYQEAIEQYREALRIRSTALTYGALGGVYFYQHKFPAAVAALETATELAPEDYRLWGNLGIYAKWAPGSETKSQPALRRAIELAAKARQVNQSDYAIYANLAEYRARLGDAKGAYAEIEHIPQAAHSTFATRIALVYELTGKRADAIAVIRSNLKSPASLSRIKDDPDFAALWREARLQ